MARGVNTPTTSWVQIASGRAVISVAERGSGRLMFNETGTDTAAYVVRPDAGEQFVQTDNETTFVKTDGADWELIIDGVI